jgi:hypothetical protein
MSGQHCLFLLPSCTTSKRLDYPVGKKGMKTDKYLSFSEMSLNNIRPGLPDFSWYNTPKREKYTKLP